MKHTSPSPGSSSVSSAKLRKARLFLNIFSISAQFPKVFLPCCAAEKIGVPTNLTVLSMRTYLDLLFVCGNVCARANKKTSIDWKVVAFASKLVQETSVCSWYRVGNCL